MKREIKKYRIGETNINKEGLNMKIIDYIRVDNIIVQFDDMTIVNTKYSDFKSGSTSNKNNPSVRGIGYVGYGDYKVFDNNGSASIYYSWKSMINRCYDSDTQSKHPTYIGCEVCNEWHNFQNYAKWYEENYYSVDNEKMHLDKDILYINNKIYSPEKCIFVPSYINSIFRGMNYAGATKRIRKYKGMETITYESYITKNKKPYYIGGFKTEEIARKKYNEEKVKYLMEIANQYKCKIPERLYVAMIKYANDYEIIKANEAN